MNKEKCLYKKVPFTIKAYLKGVAAYNAGEPMSWQEASEYFNEKYEQ